MAALIQVIARQAQQTFSRTLPEDHFSECIGTLRNLLHQIRARDLNLNVESLNAGRWYSLERSAPVAYMDICETSDFTMGVFVIRPGCRIPLHDHPGMYGLLKVIYGRLQIRSFTPVTITPTPDYAQPPKGELYEEVCDCGPEDEPKLLFPNRGNLHEVSARGDTAAAFLDILAPPYAPSAGRDCRYYKLRKSNEQKDGKDTFRVSEIPPPEEFWCESITYRGPRIVF